MFVQERLPNDITSLRIAEVSSIAVESLRKCQFQRLRTKVKHNVGFAIKYSWSRKDVVFRDGESFRLLLSDERLIRLSRFWVGKIGSMLKRRNKSNFALWRIGNVGGQSVAAHAALSPPHRGWVKKKRASLSWYSLLRGATRNRTGDTRIFSPLLYQLSYGTLRLFASAKVLQILLLCKFFW